MVWIYPWRKLEEAEIRRLLYPASGERVGWMLTAYETSEWQRCRIIGREGRVAHRISVVRECSAQEKETLYNLLWSAQIVLRCQRAKLGNPWGLACIE